VEGEGAGGRSLSLLVVREDDVEEKGRCREEACEVGYERRWRGMCVGGCRGLARRRTCSDGVLLRRCSSVGSMSQLRTTQDTLESS
jgi:hypothetical protein